MSEQLPDTIPQIAERAARIFGDAPAVVEGGQTWSFAELWGDARAAASAFLAAGITSGARIGIWAPNRREWILVTLGAQAAGAVIVPLNTRLKGREAGDILRRARCAMLFTVGDFLGTDYPALLVDQDLPDLTRIMLFDRDWEGFIAKGNGPGDPAVDAALARLSGDLPSDILFTSGTTGAPKGVVNTHRAGVQLFAAWAAATGLREGDRMLIANPFFHSFGYKAGWLACLVAGAVSLPMAIFDARATIEHIERDRISFIPGPPTLYQSLLAELAGRSFDSGSLRVAVTGAATVPPMLIQRMLDELGFDTVLTGYGMTECGVITMCRAGDPVDLVASSCGCALPGLEVRCVDDDGAALPAGQAGEVVVRGFGVMLGYLDDPEATADAIDAQAWLHTGDIGVLDRNNYLRIVDRKKDMYISGGFNCYPAEIEKLLSDHPAIDMVAVIGMSDARLGEVGAAFVVLRPDREATEAEIIAWARENIANYKIPRRVVLLDELPRNAGGKVMKDQLFRIATSPH